MRQDLTAQQKLALNLQSCLRPPGLCLEDGSFTYDILKNDFMHYVLTVYGEVFCEDDLNIQNSI